MHTQTLFSHYSTVIHWPVNMRSTFPVLRLNGIIRQ